MDEVLRSDSRLGACVAIVQFAVSVEASSSTGASSGTAAAVVVVSSHSIGSGLRVIARVSTSSMRETGTISSPPAEYAPFVHKRPLASAFLLLGKASIEDNPDR